MASKGYTNPIIKFPIVAIVDGFYDYYPTVDSYTRGKKSDVEKISQLREDVITYDGKLYERGSVLYVVDSNRFLGWNILFGFHYGHLEKQMRFLSVMSIQDFRIHGKRLYKQNEEEYESVAVNGLQLLRQLEDSKSVEETIQLFFRLANPSS